MLFLGGEGGGGGRLCSGMGTSGQRRSPSCTSVVIPRFQEDGRRIKIPIYKLSDSVYFCHNYREGDFCGEKESDAIFLNSCKHIRKSQEKTYTEIALDFDISLSNLYLYRTEQGNPTADTIDKIVDGIEKDCPEVG